MSCFGFFVRVLNPSSVKCEPAGLLTLLSSVLLGSTHSGKPHSEMHCFFHSARWYPAVITSAEGGLHLLDISYC